MEYQKYHPTQRFAVKYEHDGTHAPAGWPSEANPLQKWQGILPGHGFVEATGEELNKLREKLHPQWDGVLERWAAREVEEHEDPGTGELPPTALSLLRHHTVQAVRVITTRQELKELLKKRGTK